VRSADSSTVVPWPIEDAAHVDARRRLVGLPPLAEQARAMSERYRTRRASGPRR
jgi:hypothetical protein